MSERYFWITTILLASGTFAIRGTLIALSARLRISESTRQTFTYIPTAILPAFIIPATLLHRGQVEWIFGHERVVAIVIAALVAWWTKSTILTILVGLLVLLAMTSL